jgi:hypothetical protein
MFNMTRNDTFTNRKVSDLPKPALAQGERKRLRKRGHGWTRAKQKSSSRREADRTWTVKCILDEFEVDGRRQYLVSWEGHDEQGKPWEPSVIHAEWLINPKPALEAWRAIKQTMGTHA